ncbi:MAG: DUF4911 domain-containing protein [Nitrospinae bacterium]|nr:DUF4911 domain-containing protein [Nitrospinota bacterium]
MEKDLQIDYGDAYRIVVKVRREDIVYLNGIFESYDNLAVMRTIDRWESLIEVLASPYFVSEVKRILEELKKEIQLEIVSEDNHPSPCPLP